jgi:SAM-dependent methyltransferase
MQTRDTSSFRALRTREPIQLDSNSAILPFEDVNQLEPGVPSGRDVQRETNDPVELVKAGYDKIAPRYLEWSSSTPSPARIAYLNKLINHLPKDSAQVLEVGCGAGKPWTQLLVEHSAQVTAVDISGAQIALAKQFVPQANLIHADVMSLSFASGSFDAVVSLYCIFHLPREEQGLLLARIVRWLRPGGYLLVNLGTTDSPGAVDPDWLGIQMYWSGFDVDGSKEMVLKTGLSILEAEVLEDNEDERIVPFLWILARKGLKG